MQPSLYLGITIFSFILTSVSVVPFIDLLYKIQLKQKHSRPPTFGGVLLLFLLGILFFALFPLVSKFGVYVTSSFETHAELNIVFLTIIIFGLIGLYRDITNKSISWVLLLAGCFISTIQYIDLGISFINIPSLGAMHVGVGFIVFAGILTTLFAKGVDSMQDINGLSTGTLLVSLLALWSISFTNLDTPLSVLTAIWVGILIAFLYFNVYPSRILLGSTGAVAFGALLSVIGIILGKTIAVSVIASPFLLYGIWSIVSPKNPPHIILQKAGWPEPKIAFRIWLITIVVAIIGLWIAL